MFQKYLVAKNWRGTNELLWKNGAIDGYTSEPCYCPGRIRIALGPWHLGYFRNIFLPDLGEDQNKSYHQSAGSPALCHMVNPTLVIALRLRKD